MTQEISSQLVSFPVCSIIFFASCWNRSAVSSCIGANCPAYTINPALFLHGIPSKAIDTHLLHILPLYRIIAKMQFSKCKLHQNAILSKFWGLYFFRVDLGQFIDGQHLENRMTARISERKEIRPENCLFPRSRN